MARDNEDFLEKLNRLFYENVSNPVVGTAVDATVGMGDLLQYLLKEGATRLGVETEPYAPVAPRVKQAIGASEYDPYAPAAIAANVVGGVPRAGVNLLRSAVTKSPTLLQEGLGALAREGQSFAASEGGARVAEELYPDSPLAGIAGAVTGGTAFNTADIVSSIFYQT